MRNTVELYCNFFPWKQPKIHAKFFWQKHKGYTLHFSNMSQEEKSLDKLTVLQPEIAVIHD
jgi:hypothetical protein